MHSHWRWHLLVRGVLLRLLLALRAHHRHLRARAAEELAGQVARRNRLALALMRTRETQAGFERVCRARCRPAAR